MGMARIFEIGQMFFLLYWESPVSTADILQNILLLVKEGNLKEFLSETGDFKSSEGISGSTTDLIFVMEIQWNL